MKKFSPMPWQRFLGGIFTVLVLGLALFTILFQPALGDFALMSLLMSITALISVLATYLAYRAGWITRSPRLRWTLMGGYVLAGGLVFLNVWVTARMMFASVHDLLLATVLLVFATGIAVSVGFFLSAVLTERIQLLEEGARSVARGALDTRLTVQGRDEMAALTDTFNQMVQQLDAAQQKQRELDVLRRELIAWVGHDLRTPLTSIRAIVEALADGVVEDPQTAQRYLRTAQQDIRTLAHLIDDLFEMAKLDAGGLQLDLQPCAWQDLVSDTLESFSEVARREGVCLEGQVEAGLAAVCLDGVRISRVLSNLVGNALRHTPAGGRVTVSARRVGEDVLLEVADTGEGIAEQDQPHIFERFYRGEKSRSRATGGAGLGLSIARGIIEAHGGQIGLRSSPGAGATFFFTLPFRSTGDAQACQTLRKPAAHW